MLDDSLQLQLGLPRAASLFYSPLYVKYKMATDTCWGKDTLFCVRIASKTAGSWPMTRQHGNKKLQLSVNKSFSTIIIFMVSQAVGLWEREPSFVKWFAHILAWNCLLNQFVFWEGNSGSSQGKVRHIYLQKVSLWVSTKWQLSTQQQVNVVWRSSTSNTDSWSAYDLKPALQAISEWQVI